MKYYNTRINDRKWKGPGKGLGQDDLEVLKT